MSKRYIDWDSLSKAAVTAFIFIICPMIFIIIMKYLELR